MNVIRLKKQYVRRPVQTHKAVITVDVILVINSSLIKLVVKVISYEYVIITHSVDEA